MKIKGILVAGMGEGKKFLSMEQYRKGFEKLLGFSPYPGTLNLKLDGKGVEKIRELRKINTHEVPGFVLDGKQYFQIKAYRATLEEEGGAVIFPFLNHHPEGIIEFITKENMREKLGLKDGNELEIEIFA